MKKATIFPVPIVVTVFILVTGRMAAAGCYDIVNVSTELPHHVVTPNNVVISYRYDLEKNKKKDHYFVSWTKDEKSGGNYGPFGLTRGCKPAKLRWESNKFLVLEAGCGTFCWYYLVIPLTQGRTEYIKLWHPLAFDKTRNLVVMYSAKDVIRVRSLENGCE